MKQQNAQLVRLYCTTLTDWSINAVNELYSDNSWDQSWDESLWSWDSWSWDSWDPWGWSSDFLWEPWPTEATSSAKAETLTRKPTEEDGGKYSGTQTWPSAGTWTISYEAPVTLYVWVMKHHFNAGVDAALSGDGWEKVDAGDFKRSDNHVLNVWIRSFSSGSQCQIETTGFMVGGVVSNGCQVLRQPPAMHAATSLAVLDANAKIARMLAWNAAFPMGGRSIYALYLAYTS
ncbi:unnamed protein product, partial [Symbiodinium microadriaticum]